MKKSLYALIVSVLLISLCSCGNASVSKNSGGLLAAEKYIDWDNFSAEKPTGAGSRFKHYFDTLSETQKKAYNNIFYEIMNAEDRFPEQIEVPLMKSNELTQVYEAVIYDNPEIMCFGKDASIVIDGRLCFFKPEYTMIPSEFHRRASRLSEKAEKFCSVFPDGMSDFDKELCIHDYIVKNCVYDCDKYGAGLAYTCLFSGYASCEGYSKAMKYLLEKAGIESLTVLGDAENLQGNTESHMWNLVKIDGDYYYLDATWDDPDENTGLVSHAYFNLSEKEIRADHSNFTSFMPCENTKANYFVKTGGMFSSSGYYDRLKMENIIVSRLKKGENRIEFRFANKDVYNEATDYFIAQGMAYEIQESIKRQCPELNMADEISYSKNPKYCLIEFIF